MSQSLGWYLNDASELLRDNQNLFTSKTQLTRWVNSGRRKTAQITGCIRQLIAGTSPAGASAVPGSFVAGGAMAGFPVSNTFQTIANVELYSYGFANQFLTQITQGIAGISDVLDLAVSYNGTRPMMTWMPWDELQAYARSWNNGMTSLPCAWSCQGDGNRGQVYVWPVADQVCEMEWDCICYPSDLSTNDDYDALPESFQDAVKYYAAMLAFKASGRHMDAAQMRIDFLSSCGISRTDAARGKVPDYYWLADFP